MSTKDSKSSAISEEMQQPRILLVGNDKNLLCYREQVLRGAGWPVLSMLPGEAARVGYEVDAAICIACHSLTPAERADLVHAFKKRRRLMRLLAIRAPRMGIRDLAGFDDWVENLEGPAALIRKVHQQLSLL